MLEPRKSARKKYAPKQLFRKNYQRSHSKLKLIKIIINIWRSANNQLNKWIEILELRNLSFRFRMALKIVSRFYKTAESPLKKKLVHYYRSLCNIKLWNSSIMLYNLKNRSTRMKVYKSSVLSSAFTIAQSDLNSPDKFS